MKEKSYKCWFFLLLFAFAGIFNSAYGQDNTYTLRADSVKITNCDSSELIIENHTQNIPGFLYNTGNGRTIFKRGVLKVNDSLFLIGNDSLKYNAWVQGGNAFGRTGIFGTKDFNHLDFYTNNTPWARLTNTGNFLIGTTTDNGSKLQVAGPSTFSGNVNIGTSTITNTGSLIGTNAILFNHTISESHVYQINDVYVSRLENVLYNYQNRLIITTDTSADGTINLQLAFPPDEISSGVPGLVYGQGYLELSFWSDRIPQNVSAKFYDALHNIWAGPFVSGGNLNTTGSGGYFRIAVPAINYVSKIQIAITPKPGISVNLQNIEYLPTIGDQGLSNGSPVVTKSRSEHLYNNLYFKYQGTDNLMLSPTVYSYFLNGIRIGASSDDGTGAKLQVTGGLSVSGNIRFNNLPLKNYMTRVLVADSNGFLYFRDAATLGTHAALGKPIPSANPVFDSSLTVQGDIFAQRLSLRPSSWADFVFSPQYHRTPLDSLEQYILTNRHLPGIPSAGEVGEKGVEMGTQLASFLQNLEELTLHLIDQNKKSSQKEIEIKTLQKDILNLKEENQLMKDLLLTLQSELNDIKIDKHKI